MRANHVLSRVVSCDIYLICVYKQFVQLFIQTSRVYLTFTIGRNIWKTDGYIDPQTVYVHMYTLKNSLQNPTK